MDERLEILVLNKQTAELGSDDLLRADQETYKTLGIHYSHEEWGEKEFLMDLPDKWKLSHSVVGANNELIGFLIASRKGDCAHIHRFAVREKWRHMGVGKRLFQRFVISVKREGLQWVTLTVGAENQEGILFYRQLGFQIGLPTNLRQPLQVPQIVDGKVWMSGHPYYWMSLTL